MEPEVSDKNFEANKLQEKQILSQLNSKYGLKLWNNLPPLIKNKENFLAFKRMIKTLFGKCKLFKALIKCKYLCPQYQWKSYTYIWLWRITYINFFRLLLLTCSKWLLLKPGTEPWTWTLKNLAPEKSTPLKTWTPKNLDLEKLDPEKYGPWKTWDY